MIKKIVITKIQTYNGSVYYKAAGIKFVTWEGMIDWLKKANSFLEETKIKGG